MNRNTSNRSKFANTQNETLSMANLEFFQLASSTPTLDSTRGGQTVLDEETYLILQIVFFIILSLFLGLLGTTTNIINLIIFVKQGLFSAGSTINLFFLAVADLGVTFTNVLQSIGFAVIVAGIPNLPVDPFAIVYLSVGWPHTIFITMNRMITAYVAFERCMCVVIPFHVQRVFTPRRSLVNLLIVFAYGIASHIPVYFTERIINTKQEGTNVTKLVLVFTSDREFWHNIVMYTNYFAISFLSVITVVICTIVTAAYVKTSKKWRKTMSGSTHSAPQTKRVASDMDSLPKDATVNSKKEAKVVTDKETRLVKMIITISLIFCLCYVPELTLSIARSIDSRIRTKGQYERITGVMYAVTFVFATLNSSINIFVYYRMSSNYRKEFLSYCGRKRLT